MPLAHEKEYVVCHEDHRVYHNYMNIFSPHNPDCLGPECVCNVTNSEGDVVNVRNIMQMA